MNQPSFNPKQIISLLNLLIVAVLLLLVVSGGLIASLMIKPGKLPTVAGTATTANKTIQPASPRASTLWEAPLESSLPAGSKGEMIRYGKELIAHTSLYLGPKGTVAQISNGLNCQNCHLQAGTKPFGNNYGGVASTYPQVRARSGRETSIASRVNGCFERSLNGRPLKEDSKEMQAIVAYIKWLGQDVEKGKKPEGAGLATLAYLDEPANPAAGKLLYEQKCRVSYGKRCRAGQWRWNRIRLPPTLGRSQLQSGGWPLSAFKICWLYKSQYAFWSYLRQPTTLR